VDIDRHINEQWKQNQSWLPAFTFHATGMHDALDEGALVALVVVPQHTAGGAGHMSWRIHVCSRLDDG
jgi:hypothetical protein